MQYKSFDKKTAIHILSSAAKDYKRILEGHNYIFIYKNRRTNKIEFFESVFLPRNFQHLSGIEYIDEEGKLINNSVQFYNKCLENRLMEKEIQFRKDGTTELKLKALPMIVNFLKSSKMTALYNGIRPKLVIERMVGTTSFCLGFTYDTCGFYIPTSALLEDIRNLSEEAYQILAILSKKSNGEEKVYRDIKYVAKGVSLDKLTLPEGLYKIISLENYENKNRNI